MKKLCLFVLVFPLAFNVHAQNPVDALTGPAETFSNRKGIIMERHFDEVGKIATLNIQLEYMHDLTSNDKMSCIRFDVQPSNSQAIYTALLDSNEANELITFLKYITANIITETPVNPNTEISYGDKYNLLIGCYWQKNDGWIIYIRTDSENAQSEADIYRIDFAGLLKMITLAKSELQ